MVKVNLEEISNKFGIFKGFSIHSNPDLIEKNFKKAMKEACRQVLELGYENARLNWHNDEEGVKFIINKYDYFTSDITISIKKQSILNTINQVE